MKFTIAWVSGSLAGPLPANCESPGTPIGPHLYGKLRFRSTPLSFERTWLAWPSGFIDSTIHNSTPSGTGLARSSSTIATPSSSSPWITPITRTRRPPAVPNRSATIGRPPADSPRPTRSASRSSGPIVATSGPVVVLVVATLLVLVDAVLVELLVVVGAAVVLVGPELVGEEAICAVATSAVEESDPHAAATTTTAATSNVVRITETTVPDRCGATLAPWTLSPFACSSA